MNRFFVWIVLVALAAGLGGVAFGALVLSPQHRAKVKMPAQPPSVVAPVAADQPVHLNVGSAFPTSAPQFGTMAAKLADKVARASGASIEVSVHEPGTVVALDKLIDAVANGDLDAAWATPNLWFDRDPAFAFFGSVPFGPRGPEFLSWIYYGGGRELLDDLFAQNNIVAVPCGLAAPEAGGWFRNELRGPEDLKGLKIRFMGLGALVMQKLGAEVQQIAGGEIYHQLQLGNIDATEFSQPAIDQRLGFFQVVRNYYFPGWHQQATMIHLLVSRPKWELLSDPQKAIVEMSCGDNIREGLAEGDTLQLPAIREMKDKGAQIRKFPPAVMAALEKAWQDVASEQAEKSADFKKALDSYSAFRKDYTAWRKLNSLD